MGAFSKISLDAFNELQTDAGVLLKTFDPTSPTLVDEDIICATTGGINPTCVPNYEDWGADVDNCPENTMELMRISGWSTSLGFTALSVTADVIKMNLGASDVTDENGVAKIVPRKTLKATDFTDVWWVGDLSDGGLVAICLKNALSTSGFSLQTTKNGKGQLSVTLSGHTSIKEQDTVPMEFYVVEGTETAVNTEE